MKKSDMYKFSIKQWNPFQGCKYDCVYCDKSFKAQAKRQKQNCIKCYNYEPHYHPERLEDRLPISHYMEFIFTCASGDISFCSTEFLNKIVTKMFSRPCTQFLIQSKNPITFNRVKFPKNVIIGTTIETDDDELYSKHNISKAPLPSQRYKDFLSVEHPSKMITIEPIMPFNRELIKWVENINPIMVWIGYESKGNTFPGPSYKQFKELCSQISELHIPVILKTIKK